MSMAIMRITFLLIGDCWIDYNTTALCKTHSCSGNCRSNETRCQLQCDPLASTSAMVDVHTCIMPMIHEAYQDIEYICKTRKCNNFNTTNRLKHIVDQYFSLSALKSKFYLSDPVIMASPPSNGRISTRMTTPVIHGTSANLPVSTAYPESLTSMSFAPSLEATLRPLLAEITKGSTMQSSTGWNIEPDTTDQSAALSLIEITLSESTTVAQLNSIGSYCSPSGHLLLRILLVYCCLWIALLF